MNEREYKQFFDKNKLKISKYANNLTLIAFKIQPDDFEKAFDDLYMINPKTAEMYELIAMCMEMSKILTGSSMNWYKGINWKEFINDFEPEITEVIEYFKQLYPLDFLFTYKHLFVGNLLGGRK